MLQSIGVAHAVGEQFIHLADRSDFRGHLSAQPLRDRHHADGWLMPGIGVLAVSEQTSPQAAHL